MQEAAAEPGRRPAQQFVGVDLRRPKGYAVPSAAVVSQGTAPAQQFVGVDLRRPKGYAAPSAAVASQATAPAAAAAVEGDPCPRCESRDTKFCYYNNYNTSQPRYFCKGCRRYWTKGGTLRNVPVGGGTRKKPSSSAPPSSPPAAKPKKPYKKKRRVALPEPSSSAPVAADSAKTGTDTATTDTASEITTELVVPAAEGDALAQLLQPDDAAAVALGLGLSDFPAGKVGLVEPDYFEWPAAFDLSACWGSAGFADPDPDPGLFLNLP